MFGTVPTVGGRTGICGGGGVAAALGEVLTATALGVIEARGDGLAFIKLLRVWSFALPEVDFIAVVGNVVMVVAGFV
jgi:hypothetical protein